MAQKEDQIETSNTNSTFDEDYPFWLQAPFRLLTDVTQFRKVDPWDLEVADLITKFVERMRVLDKINFPVLGRAILSAAILYRSKVTDLIKLIETTDDKTEELDVLSFDIPEIAPSYHISQRPVTFNELVYAFQGLLKQESRYKHRLILDKRKALIQPLQLPAKPVRLVDEESTKIAAMKKDIYKRLVKLHSEHKRPIFFEELLLPNSTKITVVRGFLCILFLSFELKAILIQTEDFGKITLTPIRDNEEEFLGEFTKVIEEKLKDGTPEDSVIISETSEDEEFLVETDLLFTEELETEDSEIVFDEESELEEKE